MIEVIKKQVEAFNEHDAEAMASCFAPKAEILTFPDGDVVCAGRDGLMAKYEGHFKDFSELRCEVLSVIERAPFTVLHERLTGAKQDGPIDAVVTYEVQDGLITRAWVLTECTN